MTYPGNKIVRGKSINIVSNCSCKICFTLFFLVLWTSMYKDNQKYLITSVICYRKNVLCPSLAYHLEKNFILFTLLIHDSNLGRLQHFSGTNTFNPMYSMFTSSSIPPGAPVFQANGPKQKRITLGQLDFQSLPVVHPQHVARDDPHVEMTGL